MPNIYFCSHCYYYYNLRNFFCFGLLVEQNNKYDVKLGCEIVMAMYTFFKKFIAQAIKRLMKEEVNSLMSYNELLVAVLNTMECF